MEEEPDEVLMARVATADSAAFSRLLARHVAFATALAGRMTGSRADAEDIVQEAFLRVWKTAPRWRADGASFRTWFSRVLVNLCIDRHRRPKPLPLEAAGDPPDAAAAADQRLMESEEAVALKRAVSRLPSRQRAALALCYWQEMSNIEAAEILDLSVGAVESLLVRARRRLRAMLEAELATGRPAGSGTARRNS